MMQQLFVLFTFLLAAGYLVNKFVWSPISDKKKKAIGTLDGGNTKCGNDNCGCN
jgi:flagellar biogenesis protein FliO